MDRTTVETTLMNSCVKRRRVLLITSTAPIVAVSLGDFFAMEMTIVETRAMNRWGCARTSRVRKTSFSAIHPATVFRRDGNVMESLTVMITQMNLVTCVQVVY